MLSCRTPRTAMGHGTAGSGWRTPESARTNSISGDSAWLVPFVGRTVRGLSRGKHPVLRSLIDCGWNVWVSWPGGGRDPLALADFSIDRFVADDGVVITKVGQESPVDVVGFSGADLHLLMHRGTATVVVPLLAWASGRRGAGVET